MFSALYDRVMRWVQSPRAPWYLGGLSFAESSFFPIPPDVMLAPMSLAQPERAWRYALVTTLTSVLGGLLGYLIGLWLFDAVAPSLHELGYWDAYLQARAWFDRWGFWAVLLAGFSPIPYKVFTITAGTIGMNPLAFLMASVVGRGARFYLVAGLMRWGGEPMERRLRANVDRIGWLTVAACVLLYLVVELRG